MNDSTRPDTDRPAGPRIRRFLIGALVVVATVALGALAWVSRDDSQETTHYEFSFPDDYIGTVWFTVDSPDGRDRQVTVEWGRLRTSFVHTGKDPVTYFFDRGGLDGRLGPLLVEVTPPADVSSSYGAPPIDGVDIGAKPWDVIPVVEGTIPPEPVNSGKAYARASVNEWVSYGLNVVGVSVRAAPKLGAEKIGVVKHGEVYEARCWTRGEQITNGNYADPSDDNAQYTTDVWYLIDTPAGSGYISDVWFARRANADRLNLPECPP